MPCNNSLSAELSYLTFHALEVVSHYHVPKLQVKNYSFVKYEAKQYFYKMYFLSTFSRLISLLP